MQTIHDLQDYLSRDSVALADSALLCPYCGRTHKVPFGHIRIGRGAVQQVPDLAERILGHKPQRVSLVYDRAIQPLIEAMVLSPLQALGVPVVPFGLGQPGLLLDSEVNLGNQAADALDPQTDLIVGAGSGVISDLTKWIATRTNKPFINCGSAPSMNSYTSITATITENDIKISRWLNPANAVVMDVDLLSTAPKEMITAGMGDLVARAVCNADWMLANQLTGAYFCPLPYQMTAENERRYLSQAEGLGRAEPQAIEALSEAILISGYSMTVLDGETSPSSGAEHVISHFWDLLMHIRGLPRNFHGTQVGVGSLIMLAMYDYVRGLDPARFDPQTLLRRRPTLEQLEAENRDHFGAVAESFNQVTRKKYRSDADYLEFVGGVQRNWGKLWEQIDPYLASFESIYQPMCAAGAVTTLAGLQRTPAEGMEALLFGSRYRARYTLLDLAWELGIFPDAAQEILQQARVI